ncbi:ABC transporter substrate-binding protein [Bradyrhizobium sp.]|jgi:putative ABC transport system substrate-binding protein|uniref:ABC transporter substrate-binding protein n=1 Tax=Bradyrhizobium sp. TaxID=376 RepID=UPI003D0C9555
MRRREFITLLGGGVAVWPVAARAQAPERMRRVGVLMGFGENDPEAKVWLSGFTQELQRLGWTDGRNARLEVRWAAGNIDRIRTFAKELVGLQPDVILAHGTPVTAALQRETRTIPIVFVTVADPVGQSFVASLRHPGGNITGFVFTEAAMGGKWLELLKEIAPSVKRAAIMFNPDTAPGGGSYYLPSFEEAGRLLKVEPITAPVHNVAEIETSITSLGHEPGGGLVAGGDAFMVVHRAPTILLAAQNNIPAIYFNSSFVRDGGLLSYGPHFGDIFLRAAPYVDRILKGEKPADLPVQVPTKFELAINLKTANALGLNVPMHLQQRADEVIE